MNLGVKPVSFTSLSGSWMSGDGVPGHFPAGLRVLVVDDDPTCLMILEQMLKNCLYEVTTCNQAEVALRFLRNNKNGYDIVISDVHMPDMDGFKLLEHVGLEMDLPVIMMSVDDSKNVVMKGVTHGACDYLIKPVRMEALKNIWQHVVRKKKHEWKERDFDQSGSVDDGERQKKLCDLDYSSSANEGNWKNSKRGKDEEDETEERDDSSTLKKPRVVWSVELHQQFVTAVNQLGIDKAVPKKILELMNVPGLTRENVASHLQKYRLYLRRLSGVSLHQNGLGNTFLGPPDVPFGSISLLHSIDLQALAASGQFPPQSLAVIQAAQLGQVTTKSSTPAPHVDQPDVFNFENPKLRSTEGKQQQENTNAKQVNLLHGIPTNMDSKQLAALQRSAQSFGNMNLQGHSQASQNNLSPSQMAQPHSMTPILNETSRSHVLDLPSSVGQPVLPIPSSVLGCDGIDNVCTVSQSSIPAELSRSQNTEFPGSSSFSRVSSSSSSLTSKLHNKVNSEMKGSSAYLSCYNVFNNLKQHRTQDWCSKNIGSTCGVPEHSNVVQGGLDVLPSVLVHQQFSSNPKRGNTQNISQQINTCSADNLLRIKAERLPDMGFQNGLVPENICQEDLMSALLKLQQEGVGGELGFDGISFG